MPSSEIPLKYYKHQINVPGIGAQYNSASRKSQVETLHISSSEAKMSLICFLRGSVALLYTLYFPGKQLSPQFLMNTFFKLNR